MASEADNKKNKKPVKRKKKAPSSEYWTIRLPRLARRDAGPQAEDPKSRKPVRRKKGAKRAGYWLIRLPPLSQLIRVPRLTRRNAIALGITCLLLAVLIPGIIGLFFPGTRAIAAFFTREVHSWESQIGHWAAEYNLDPNLIATVMQIESCGDADAVSYAGAQGLFQVMPMHFTAEEQADGMTDPETNARQGMRVLADCLERAEGDAGLALACYNGGASMITRAQTTWPDETRRYYIWGGGIYADARRGATQSSALDDWLRSGGWSLCQRASAALGVLTSTPPAFPVEVPTLAPMTLPPFTESPSPNSPTMAIGSFTPPTALPPGVFPTFDASAAH